MKVTVRIFVFLGMVLLTAGGCGPAIEKDLRICPGKREAVLAVSSLGSHRQNAVGLKAKGQCLLRYHDEDGRAKKENFPVRLWFNPPDEIYLQGDVAFDPRGIVLGSNAEEFWLAIRLKEISTYWWGQWSEQVVVDELAVDPKILLEVIGVPEVGGREHWSLSNEGAFDVLTRRGKDGTIVKRVYVYNCDYQVRKIEYFRGDGELAVVAELDKYKEVVEGFSVPTVIKIVKCEDDDTEESVRIRLGPAKAAAFDEKARSILFVRPKTKGFKRVIEITSAGPMVEP